MNNIKCQISIRGSAVEFWQEVFSKNDWLWIFRCWSPRRRWPQTLSTCFLWKTANMPTKQSVALVLRIPSEWLCRVEMGKFKDKIKQIYIHPFCKWIINLQPSDFNYVGEYAVEGRRSRQESSHWTEDHCNSALCQTGTIITFNIDSAVQTA